MDKVHITSEQVVVENLVIANREVAGFLEKVPEPERPKALVHAAEVGVFCLERASFVRDLDFVRQQFDQQLRVITGEMEKIPLKVEQELLKKVGTNDGQVLAPVATLVATTDRVIHERLKTVQTLLDGEIDPRRPDTTLGKAIATITGLLDAQREDSVQKVLEKAVQSVASDDGCLVAGLKRLLPTLLKPLQDEVDRLALEIRGQQEVAAALADTTAKGAAFEEEVLPTIQCWAKFAGATVEHVGGDRQPGDILVNVHDHTLPMNPFVIVIEARDENTARGKKHITDDLGRGLATRAGHFGIYLAKTQAGLGKEIGDWAEGRTALGPYIACTLNNLITALRFAVLQTRLQALQNARPEADLAAIQSEVDRARTALRRVRTIKTKAGDITREADDLNQEVNEALVAMEKSLRGPAASAA